MDGKTLLLQHGFNDNMMEMDIMNFPKGVFLVKTELADGTVWSDKFLKFE
jgi:hypothetical protein